MTAPNKLSDTARRAAALAREALACAVDSNGNVPTGGEEAVLARRLLLDALLRLRPEYQHVLGALRDSEFNISDNEAQADCYDAAAEEAAALRNEYIAREARGGY